MIEYVYVTKVSNSIDRQFGFGSTPDGSRVYIPAKVIKDFEMNPTDEGSCDKMLLEPNGDERSDYRVVTLVTDDEILRESVEKLRERIAELEAALNNPQVL